MEAGSLACGVLGWARKVCGGKAVDFCCVCAKLLSRVRLCHPMNSSPPGSSVHGILRQEYWSGLPFPSPGDLPDPGIKPTSLMSPALAGGFFTTSATWEVQVSAKSESEVTQSCPILCDPWTIAYKVPPPWNYPGESTGVRSHFLLQGIFPTQGSNSGLPRCRQILLPSEPPGKLLGFY